MTWLWLDAPYVIAARKLFNWAVEANNNGDVFPVSAVDGMPYCAFPCIPGIVRANRGSAVLCPGNC